MDDPVFKSKYQKYKYKVKLWEKSFRKINGRIPSKHDIREAPLNIRDAYKMYYKLKSSFLEDTLNDVLDEDGFDLSMDNSQLDGSSSGANFSTLSDTDSFVDGLPSLGDISAVTNALNGSTHSESSTHSTAVGMSFSNVNELAPHALTNLRNVDDNHVLSEFEAETSIDQDVAALNAKAWGANLNRSTAASPSDTAVTRGFKSTAAQDSLRKDVTKKLFRNATSSFATRNPRKSLARGSAQPLGALTGQMQPQMVLPDLETILNERAKKEQELELAQSAPVALQPIQTVAAANELKTVVDQGWLKRCSAVHGFDDVSTTDRSATVAAQPVKMGLSNLNIPLLKPQEPTATVAPTVKETYAQNTYADDLRDGDDEDEIIENSEDESNSRQNTTNVRHVLKKRKVHDVRPVQSQPPEEVKPEPKPEIRPKKAAQSKKPPKTPTRKSAATKKTAKVKTSPKLSATPSTPARRSKRAVRRSSHIVSPVVDENPKEEEEFEEDGHNSDADPEFSLTSERKKRVNVVVHSDDDDDRNSAESDDAHDKPPAKKPITRKSTAKRTAASARGNGKSAMTGDDQDEPDEEDEPSEYGMEFGTEFAQSVPRVDVNELLANTQAFQSYVCSTDAPNTSTGGVNANEAIHIPLTKREMERDKFEKRIAAGSLNDNYVRINIEKKKFVRGHKTTNFSKFKKSEWRKTKVANALAGPEMDMRGCDGGYLLCFSCGKQGHFAQDCKIQSDRLLSLDADVEVSEYPTMAEVEQMVEEKARSVFGYNPNELTLAEDQEMAVGDDEAADSDEDEVHNNEPAKKQSEPARKEPARVPAFIGHRIPDDFLKLSGYNEATVANSESMRPLYELDADGNVREPPAEVMDALRLFGHTAFRKGQDRAVMRVLSGQATLVTLSTGSGKSLCYQLPAYMYRQHQRQCITLVISPLVSLMEDQVQDVPSFLNAQCLHTNQTKAVRQRIMEQIKAGVVDVLLISPEAVVAGEKATGFGSLLRELPPIAFACIDEAHCMSQWSHNFRPSYLMICRVLQEKLKVRTVLGLTATATLPTRESIVRHLAIPDGLRGVISDVPLPNNLLLTVSRDANRDLSLVKLLSTEKFAAFQSIIVYCTRRDECERVATYIRTCFQDEEKRLKEQSEAESAAANGGKAKKRRRQKSLVECYHAGLGASRRKKIQNEFMRSDLKIVVATIAFGMGINKADIRAVIHYNMPMTYEGYTQEVGRAGRDGKPSHCHLFLDSNKKDLFELRRHVYANSIDRHVIRKLLRKVFVSCACQHNLNLKEYQSEVDAVQNMSWTDDMDDTDGHAVCSPAAAAAKPPQAVVRRKCPGHESSFSIEATVQELDIPEENISTLLCYLELHEQRYIQVLSRAYCSCKVMSYGGPHVLKAAARTCAPLAMAIALDMKRGVSHTRSTLIEFRPVDVASAIGWDSGIVKYQLKNLEWTTVNGQSKRSSISVEFSDLGFRVRSPGDLSDSELDATLDLLYNRVTDQELTQLMQLQNVFNGMSTVAFDSYSPVVNRPEEAERHSDELKLYVRDYFQRAEMDRSVKITDEQDLKDVPDDVIKGDVRTMMSRYPDNQFTGRTLARIFHGVASPVYPAQIWSRCQFWRQHTRIDFNRIVSLANALIVKART